ncbi:hypothetical protein J6500_11030 [Bradyrhizobium sp. WSM 1704]|uniref:hypothetical protein n=1 Tax=Bradyrhizobium semiaridum TaxID=2821404 RepID=UPI001CE36F91|nr:hypothetical protein [Bradyrhizobium semiaridum]MCA6122420.1 hypothetical protein [Bradyrhizobium semiaridum]
MVESSSRFSSLFEHDLFGKPLRTFPDHALGLIVFPIQSCHRPLDRAIQYAAADPVKHNHLWNTGMGFAKPLSR